MRKRAGWLCHAMPGPEVQVDTVEAHEVARLSALLHSLNRGADIIPVKECAVDPKRVINTSRFSMAKAAAYPGWLQVQQHPS